MVTAEALANSMEPKNWAFPKIHILLQHALNEIMAKGITATYNTKPNESFHKPIRVAWRKTNGKDIDEQVSELRCNVYMVLIYADFIF